MPMKKYKKKYPKKPFKKSYNKNSKYKRYKAPDIAYGIHYFKRTVNCANENGLTVDGTLLSKSSSGLIFTNNATAAGTTVYGYASYIASLQNLPNVTEFTGLFDDYQIRKVVIKIYPQATTSETAPVGTNNGTWACDLHYAIDHDDATAPSANESGIQTLQQYSSYTIRKLVGARPISIVLKPRAAMAAYKGTFTGYASSMPNQWFDCANNDTQFYGIKMVVAGVSPTTSIVNLYLRIEATYYLKFKTPR